MKLTGIHHVTAICGDPQRNVDFYAGVLGLRLVKKTVNFDDPTTYHLYYGDDEGRPGTILTFFPWPGAAGGRPGTGQVTATAFRVPEGSLGYWRKRLEGNGAVALEEAEGPALAFEDPDGLRLELAGVPAEALAERQGVLAHAFTDGPVPPEHAVRGFLGITVTERVSGPTRELLTGTLGFREVASGGDRTRFRAAADDGPGTMVDLLERPEAPSGRVAAGTVHHVAFRTPDRKAQEAWRRRLAEAGLRVTEIKDRRYFTSIYFREPGGALFEIATEGPGFTADEEAARLGSELRLPPWLERRRAELESVLPPIRPPASTRESEARTW